MSSVGGLLLSIASALQDTMIFLGGGEANDPPAAYELGGREVCDWTYHSPITTWSPALMYCDQPAEAAVVPQTLARTCAKESGPSQL